MTNKPCEYQFQWFYPVSVDDYYDWLTKALGGDRITQPPSPPPHKILTHCLEQLIVATESGDSRPDWQLFSEALEAAREGLEGNDVRALCAYFFQLGQWSGKLSMPSEEKYLNGMKAELGKHSRELPIMKKNIASQACRETAQYLAVETWKLDVDKKIRVSEMAQMIWAKMYEIEFPPEFIKALPDRADGIKPWLRTVAPDYARSPGRPPKVKK